MPLEDGGLDEGCAWGGPLTALAREDAPTRGLSVEVLDRDTGRTDVIDQVWGEDYSEAARAAAGIIYARAIFAAEPIYRQVPEGLRWTADDGQSITKYHEAIELEDSEEYEAAEVIYTHLIASEPGNALPRLRLASLKESAAGSWIEALTGYVDALEAQADLPLARYRLAVCLSSASQIASACREREADETTGLFERLRRVVPDAGTTDETFAELTSVAGDQHMPPDLNVPLALESALLRFARRQWSGLETVQRKSATTTTGRTSAAS